MCTAGFYPRYIFQTATRALRTSFVMTPTDIMSTWKNLCSERLGSKVTSGIMGACGDLMGSFLFLSRIRGSLSSISRATLRSYIAAVRYEIRGMMIIEEEEEEETDRRSQTQYE